MQWISQYKESLKPKGSEEPVDLLIYRPLGFVLAAFIRKTFITPNHLTYLSMVFGFISGFYLFFDYPITGVLFFQISIILDCADGQLARLTRKYSIYGRALDGISDYVAFISFYNGAAWYFYFHQATFSIFSVYGFLIVIGVLVIIQAVSIDYYRNLFFNQLKNQDLEKELVEVKKLYSETKRFSFKRFVYSSYHKYLKGQLSVLKVTVNKEETLKKLSRRIYLGLSTSVLVLSLSLVFNAVPFYFLWTLLMGLYLFSLKIFNL